MTPAVYLDSSSLVKLAVREPETASLRSYLRRRRPWVTSALAHTEVVRAVLPLGGQAVEAGRAVLAHCELVRLSNRVLHGAAELLPADVRSLDAIHVQTMLLLGDDIGAVVTYDRRMIGVVEAVGLRVVHPGWKRR